MPNNIEGSETTEEVITTPDQAIEAGEKGPSEEKETPAASSADTEENPQGGALEESKPADEPKKESEEQSSEDKTEEVDTDETEEGDKSDKSQDLSDGVGEAKKPKAVEGETPKEYALRMEVSRLKAKVRQERGSKLLGDAQPQKVAAPTELSEEEKKVLEAFDPEQVANQEKLFGIMAKKHGYVRKDELSQATYKETAQAILDDFIEKNPQFEDEVLWKRFGEEYSMYRPPANPKDNLKIFNRIKNDIFGITTKDKAEKDFKTAAAKQEKVNTASAGAGGSAPRKLSDRRRASPADQELATAARSGGLKGFSEKDLADMGL